MGLFINSHLQSLSLHKKLTELEKLSEISTGILALKAMVEGGSDLSKHQLALDNLARMLPMLSPHQQQYVIDEIMTPLIRQQDHEHPGELGATMDTHEVHGDDFARGAMSDYEMEFQIKLNRQTQLDIKELNRTQRDRRHEQELERYGREAQERRREKLSKVHEKLAPKIEEMWSKIEESSGATRARHLRSFIYALSSLGEDHPKIIEAQELLAKM